MNTSLRLAIIVTIASVTGCEAPTDANESAQSAASDSASRDDHRLGEAPGVVAFGQLSDDSGAPIVDATICIRGATTCTVSIDDGSWEIGGIESGLSEMLEVHAAGFFPTLVPIEYTHGDYWFDVSMVSTEGYALQEGMGATLTVDLGARRPRRLAASAVGIQETSIAQMVPGVRCDSVTGWSGPGYDTASMLIVAGYITYIAQNCS